jgi:hypothetical protein
MKAELVAFGSIEIDGRQYDHDVVIDQGAVRKRAKKPSKTATDSIWPHAAVGRRGNSLGRQPVDRRYGGQRIASDHA